MRRPSGVPCSGAEKRFPDARILPQLGRRPGLDHPADLEHGRAVGDRQRQRDVLLGEQHVQLALEVADRAYVLQVGRVVESGPAAELRQNPRIREAFLGA